MSKELALPDTDDYSFSNWLESARQLQEVAYDAYYDRMDDETRADSMMTMLLAAHAEITEMGQECGWKPWAQPRGWINREAVISEAVDVLHFVANMLTHANCTGKELTEAYKAKQQKNLDRQLEGYDGVSDKCPGCKKCYVDPGVRCSPPNDEAPVPLAWCSTQMEYIHP